jgi:SAM-dependent methyltransferase
MTMTDWTDGYRADATYTTAFYRHTTPVWLSLATLLSGHRPPRIDRRFRWCDLGCGQGVTALGVAACHPQAEVFAFDFSPSHIDNARLMAEQAGIGNVTFAETSFAELAALPRDALPQMDFIVLHGVWSWVSSTQRAFLLQFIRDRLAPGGVVYLSSNALAGWAAMLPVQRLMRLYSEVRPGPVEEVIPGALGFLNEVIRGDAAFFAHNPLVAARLEFLAKENPHYLAHELLHATWDPTSPDAVARDLAEAKCGFIGSATLLENFDTLSVPPTMAAFIAQTGDARMKEVLRDLGASRTLRRDLFRRGTEKPLAGEVTALLDEIVLTDFCGKDEADITIATGGSTSRTLDSHIYGAVRGRLHTGPLPVGELRRNLGDLSMTREVASVLCETELAHPLLTPQPRAQAVRVGALNRVIGQHNRQGGALKYLVAPKLGTGMPADTFETMVFEEFSAGMPDDLAPAIDRLMAMLLTRGLLPQQNGVPTNPDGTRTMLAQALERFITTRLPVFQQVGILPEETTAEPGRAAYETWKEARAVCPGTAETSKGKSFFL